MGLQKVRERVDHADGSYTVSQPIDREKLPTLETVTVDDLQIVISDIMPGTRGAYRRVEAQGFTHNTRDGRKFFSTLLGYLRVAEMPDGTKLLALDPLMQPRQATSQAGKQVAPRSAAKPVSNGGNGSETPVSVGDDSDEAQDAKF